MSNLIPLKSMFNALNYWPMLDEDDTSIFTPSHTNNIEVYETENEVIVKANVAGVIAKDIDATFEKGILWIQAKANKEEKDQQAKYYSQATWNYSYKVTVPGLVDHNQEPEVTLENGILKAVFQKSAASKPKKLTVKNK